jgi:rhodanese-related sulfurtransferase
MKPELKLFIACIVIGAVAGAVASYAVLALAPRTDQSRISEFYSTENAVGVSPQDYIKALQGNHSMGLAVDLRDNASYLAGHLVGAVNIPAGQMNPPQVLNAFKKLPADKPVIVYCYSSYCMLSIEVGDYLAQNGIYVKHMNLGWAEIKQDFPDFLVNGSEPGYLSVNASGASTGCPATGGGFGC